MRQEFPDSVGDVDPLDSDVHVPVSFLFSPFPPPSCNTKCGGPLLERSPEPTTVRYLASHRFSGLTHLSFVQFLSEIVVGLGPHQAKKAHPRSSPSRPPPRTPAPRRVTGTVRVAVTTRPSPRLLHVSNSLSKRSNTHPSTHYSRLSYSRLISRAL